MIPSTLALLSLLMTDGYKFSMAEAGFPLRPETFYCAHRKGGWQYVPLDIKAFIESGLPQAGAQMDEDFAYLDTHGYSLSAGSRSAARSADKVSVTALPKGSWFYEREPIFSVTGPSLLASALEPMVLQVNRRIQVATCALRTPEKLKEMVENATCEEEKQITVETLTSMGIPVPAIVVREQDYYDAVRARAERLVAIVRDPNRIIEVGLRACSCMGQHLIALRAIRDAGILRTSNVYGAKLLGMIPIGTMGHEHIQRFGSSYAAFVAMRDRVPGFISYLPDTFTTLGEGVPSALHAMADVPGRDSAIRFDAEHAIRSQYLATIAMAREQGQNPYFILESGWDEVKTVEFEYLREMMGVPADRQGYGYGNYLVKPPWLHFGRDDVAAVYKLCLSIVGCQKMGDEPGAAKESIPGDVVLWRPHLGMAGYSGPCGWVAQRGENWKPPVPATLLSGADMIPPAVRFTARDVSDFLRNKNLGPLALSPETQRLRDECYRRRERAIAEAASFAGRS
jgi:nicotinic acid phosphoribosyltransferase